MNCLGVREWKEKDFIDLIQRYNHIFYLELEKKILGFTIIKKIRDEAEIINIVIEPNYQRRGLGYKLFNHVVLSMQMRGTKRYILEVSKENFSAKSFYRKIGFKTIAIRKNYYTIMKGNNKGDRLDAEIMEYKLK